MCGSRCRRLKTGRRVEKSHPLGTANAITNSQQLRLLGAGPVRDRASQQSVTGGCWGQGSLSLPPELGSFWKGRATVFGCAPTRL